MNIQIFGTKKSSDARKAERWFKERRVRAQYIDLMEKGISRGELKSVAQALGGLDALIDPDARDKDALARVRYAAPAQKEEILLEYPQVLKQPIVRNGKQAAAGYRPEVYEAWMREQAIGNRQ